jgi:hypothetical protein
MLLTGNENHDIPLADAAALTKNFRDTHPAGCVIAHCFGKGAISDIINQGLCEGIRIYYAQTATGDPKLVITGVDCLGNDMYLGKLAEYGHACPADCSVANPLNSNHLTT